MPRKGSRLRITPRLKGCLDNALSASSDLYLTRPPLEGPCPYQAPKEVLRFRMRSQEIVLGTLATVLPSESRVRATTSAVQDFPSVVENKKQLHHCTSAIRNRTSILLDTTSGQSFPEIPATPKLHSLIIHQRLP